VTSPVLLGCRRTRSRRRRSQGTRRAIKVSNVAEGGERSSASGIGRGWDVEAPLIVSERHRAIGSQMISGTRFRRPGVFDSPFVRAMGLHRSRRPRQSPAGRPREDTSSPYGTTQGGGEEQYDRGGFWTPPSPGPHESTRGWGPPRACGGALADEAFALSFSVVKVYNDGTRGVFIEYQRRLSGEEQPRQNAVDRIGPGRSNRRRGRTDGGRACLRGPAWGARRDGVQREKDSRPNAEGRGSGRRLAFGIIWWCSLLAPGCATIRAHHEPLVDLPFPLGPASPPQDRRMKLGIRQV